MSEDFSLGQSEQFGLMMQWEEGSISVRDFLRLFSSLIKDGDAWRLQGMYGRQAMDLITQRILDKQGDLTDIGREYLAAQGNDMLFKETVIEPPQVPDTPEGISEKIRNVGPGYLIDVAKDPAAKRKFIKADLDLNGFKPALIAAVHDGSGLYELSGGKARWEAGGGLLMSVGSEQNALERQGYTAEQASRIIDNAVSSMDTTYKAFESIYRNGYGERMDPLIARANSFRQLLDTIPKDNMENEWQAFVRGAFENAVAKEKTKANMSMQRTARLTRQEPMQGMRYQIEPPALPHPATIQPEQQPPQPNIGHKMARRRKNRSANGQRLRA